MISPFIDFNRLLSTKDSNFGLSHMAFLDTIEDLEEQEEKVYSELIYPLFEEYHIPRDFDEIIEYLCNNIREKLIEFIQKSGYTLEQIFPLKSCISREERNNLVKTYLNDFSSREDKKSEISPYSYDIEKRNCIKKDLIEIDSDDNFDETNQTQFPLVIRYFNDFSDIGIEPVDIQGKHHKIKVIKFKVGLMALIKILNNTPNSSIKTIVRHEVLHIVERFINNGNDLALFKKRNIHQKDFYSSMMEIGYSPEEIREIDSFLLLFSDTEMNARLNEMHETIKEMSMKEIEEITDSGYSITMKCIMQMFKHLSKVSLIYWMDSLKSLVQKSLEKDVFSDEYKKILGLLFMNSEYKIFNVENTRFQNTEKIRSVIEMQLLPDIVLKIEKFEMKCYKMIYNTLMNMGYNSKKTHLQEEIEDLGRYKDLFESGMIYYMYDVDNNFGVL